MYGSDNIFDSWMTLTEVTKELTEDESLVDEMMSTAEEYVA